MWRVSHPKSNVFFISLCLFNIKLRSCSFHLQNHLVTGGSDAHLQLFMDFILQTAKREYFLRLIRISICKSSSKNMKMNMRSYRPDVAYWCVISTWCINLDRSVVSHFYNIFASKCTYFSFCLPFRHTSIPYSYFKSRLTFRFHLS